jgi:hypothetical protein
MVINSISTVVGVKMPADEVYAYCLEHSAAFREQLEYWGKFNADGFTFKEFCKAIPALIQRKKRDPKDVSINASMLSMMDDTLFYLNRITYPNTTLTVYTCPHDIEDGKYVVVGETVFTQYIESDLDGREPGDSLDAMMTNYQTAMTNLRNSDILKSRQIALFTIPDDCQCCLDCDPHH